MRLRTIVSSRGKRIVGRDSSFDSSKDLTLAGNLLGRSINRRPLGSFTTSWCSCSTAAWLADVTGPSDILVLKRRYFFILPDLAFEIVEVYK